MSLSVGIVGLPNVGKSTLFNALLKKQQALVANYPFATIEPNVGVVPVPDSRLDALAEVISSQLPVASDGKRKKPPVVPATVKFVDIAGLVKGASQGEGLGNKFLAHIREVDAIVHVLRGFGGEDVVRAGSVDPESDLAVVEMELQLADLQSLEKLENSKTPELKIVEKLKLQIARGIPVWNIELSEEEQKVVRQWNLLTAKPVIKVINVDENKLDASHYSLGAIRISAKLESELAALSEEEQREYLAQLGIKETGLEKVIKEAYRILDLQSFLTAGEKEVRAWTIRRGSTALTAAGVIHTDFMTHFIKADVINWRDFVDLGGWPAGRQAGKVRQEGRDYVMQEGDVVEFKVGV